MDTIVCNCCYKTAVTKDSKSCKSCHIKYCSQKCLEDDADFHQPICRGSEKFEQKNPRHVCYIGLLFPTDHHSDHCDPKYIWVKFTRREVTGVIQEYPDLAEHIPPDVTTGKMKVKNVVVSYDAKMGKTEIFGAETKFRDGLKDNQCLTQLLGGHEQYAWRGPIVVLGRNGAGHYRNVAGSDLYWVRRYFTERMSRKRKRTNDDDLTCNFKPVRSLGQVGTFAVMISCAGDMKEFGHTKYTEVTVDVNPLTKSIAAPQETISQYLGLRLNFYALDTGVISNCWDGRGRTIEYSRNPEMQMLLVEANQYLPTWGTWSKILDAPVGSFLVVREDRMRLEPHHVEALERFSRDVVFPVMKTTLKKVNVMKAGEQHRIDVKESAMDKILTKAKFEAFFLEYKKMKLDEGYESWANIKSPLSR